MNQSHDLSTDLDRLHHAHEAPRCVHTKTNGTICKSPAMRGNIYCYFHLQIHEQPDFQAIDIGTLEDANSIQMSIQRVLSAALRGQIDQKTARLALYGLQIATRNLKHCNFEPQMAEDVVLDDRNNTLDDLRCPDPECECNDEDSVDDPRDRHKWVRKGDNTDTQHEKNMREFRAFWTKLSDCPSCKSQKSTTPSIPILPTPYTPSTDPGAYRAPAR